MALDDVDAVSSPLLFSGFGGPLVFVSQLAVMINA